jgi:hypothetical protein
MATEVWIWVLIGIAVVIAVAAASTAVRRVRGRRRSAVLHRHFGPEYDHVLDQAGGRTAGEAELERRLRRRRELDVRTLDADERERFTGSWVQAQNSFVQTPRSGLRDADLLILQVMRARGYPVEHYSEREQVISVDHPDLVGHYRAAHRVAVADAHDEAGTEQLRRAMVDYQYLFDELVGAGHPETTHRGLQAP